MPLTISPKLPALATSFTIAGPINPGASFQFSWHLADPIYLPPLSRILEHWGSVTAVLSFDGNTLYTSPALTPQSSGSGILDGDSVGQSSVSVEVSGSASYANALYKFGSHELSLTITGSAQPPADSPDLYTVTLTANLTVVQGLGVLWGWEVANPTPNWNEPYALAGIFINLNEKSAMTVTFQLYETDVTDNTPVVPRGGSTVTVPVSKTTFWTSSAITQNWGWLDCPSGIIVHPTEKEFDYQIQYQVTDEWGNFYQPGFGQQFFNSTVWVEPVSVQSYKTDDAANAFTAFEFAGDFSFSGVITILSGGAGALLAAIFAAAMAAAAAWCSAAQDPPVPDFNYNEVASVVMPLLPQVEASSELQNTLSLLREIVRHLAISSAVSATEGKLLAAKQQGSNPGIALQTGRLLELYHEDTEASGRIEQLAAGALQEVTTIFTASVMAEIRSIRRTWTVFGIPESVRDGWKQAGIPENAISAIERAIHPSSGCSCGDAGDAPQFPVDWPSPPPRALAFLVGGTLRDAKSLEAEINSLTAGASDPAATTADQTERTTATQSLVQRIETILNASGNSTQ